LTTEKTIQRRVRLGDHQRDEGENSHMPMYVKGKHQLKFGASSRASAFADIDASQKGRWNFRTDRVSSDQFPFQLVLRRHGDLLNRRTRRFAQDTWQVQQPDVELACATTWTTRFW
jgi:hypothetical protein